MKATICLEYIGEGQDANLKLWSGIMGVASGGQDRGFSTGRKPWVAEITGTDFSYGFSRSFLPARWQRKRSSTNGNRGTELWFTLESGRIYEIKHHTSWRSSRRYFVTVTDDGDILERDREWVRSHLALMSSQPHGSA